jgi:OOP family OmpA-OmpF porin
MIGSKSLLWRATLAVAILGCTPQVRAADTNGWYVGAGVGRSDVKRATSWGQLADSALLASGITSSTIVGSHDTAWKFFGGYQFNENVAVEAGYTDLGRFDGTTAISKPATATATGKWDASSPLNVAAVGIAPIKGGFSGFAKAGLALTKLSVSITPPSPASLSATRTQLLLGVGFKYDFAKSFGVRAELERFNNVGDGANTGQSAINVWSLSALYRF